MYKKRFAMIANIVLLIWYSLSMFGLKLGNKYLVEGAWKEEWIFLVIPVITFLLYIFTGKIGKYIHLVWLLMWFITQFLSHEWYTIFGSGFMGRTEDKIYYFKDCIQVANISGTYVPDLYHMILHAFIIIACTSIMVTGKSKE
ncbi:MAG: hypothetical protein PUD20_05660 [bacterium]|nr:hypothetical protein [bacterium]